MVRRSSCLVGTQFGIELEMLSLEKAEEAMTQRGKMAKSVIAIERPELMDLFLIYQNEAVAGRKILHKNLADLHFGAEILEVGGGILSLGIQLASEGFKVTTVEPTGEGFSDNSYFMSVLSEIAKKEEMSFTLIKLPIEDCIFQTKFDFAFSINVMEHLKDPYFALLHIVKTLKKGAVYRFICPNYDFPYEPHFRKWLISKTNKAFVLSRKRASSKFIPKDKAHELYNSLNFITLRKIRGNIKEESIKIVVNRNALFELMIRAVDDSELRKRHPSLSRVGKAILLLKLEKLMRLFPVNFQPTVDVQVSTLTH